MCDAPLQHAKLRRDRALERQQAVSFRDEIFRSRWCDPAERPSGGPIILIGFSLGGNVVSKLAGSWVIQRRGHPGSEAASTPIDLAACVRELDKPATSIYARPICHSASRSVIRAKDRLTPGIFDLAGLDPVRTVYDFDDRFTAPAFGFGTADNYYATQSSNQFLDRIRVPRCWCRPRTIR